MPSLPGQTKLTLGRVDKAGDALVVKYVVLVRTYTYISYEDGTEVTHFGCTDVVLLIGQTRSRVQIRVCDST